MGKFVYNNAYFAIDSTAATQVDLSDHVKSLTLNLSNTEVDSTCMAAGGLSRLKGLQDWSMDIEFAQDFASTKVNATLFRKMNSTAPQVTVSFRPTNASAGTSNPEYRGEGIVFEYTPASGSVGDLAVASISIRAAADSSASHSMVRLIA